MMKNFKGLIVFILAITVVFTLAACGGGDTSSTGADNSASELRVESATIEGDVPEADINTSGDELLGDWVEISDPSLFAKVAKTDSAYQYEDNDGQYTATFENGKLKVMVSDAADDFAEVYVSPETGHLLVLYQGGLVEYEKK